MPFILWVFIRRFPRPDNWYLALKSKCAQIKTHVAIVESVMIALYFNLLWGKKCILEFEKASLLFPIIISSSFSPNWREREALLLFLQNNSCCFGTGGWWGWIWSTLGVGNRPNLRVYQRGRLSFLWMESRRHIFLRASTSVDNYRFLLSSLISFLSL